MSDADGGEEGNGGELVARPVEVDFSGDGDAHASLVEQVRLANLHVE